MRGGGEFGERGFASYKGEGRGSANGVRLLQIWGDECGEDDDEIRKALV